MSGEDDKFEVYADKTGKWRWRRVAPNGTVVGAACKGHATREDCEANMRRGPVATDAWAFYEDRRGEWRWRRATEAGEVVGAASEGYKARGDAEANARRHGFGG